MSRQWLHRADYAHTLRLLQEVVGNRADHEELGYLPEEDGADVDWEALTSPEAKVSSTEHAVLLIAHGCSIIERHGGLPPRLRGTVAAIVEAVS
jgi:hypothetical protein